MHFSACVAQEKRVGMGHKLVLASERSGWFLATMHGVLQTPLLRSFEERRAVQKVLGAYAGCPGFPSTQLCH